MTVIYSKWPKWPKSALLAHIFRDLQRDLDFRTKRRFQGPVKENPLDQNRPKIQNRQNQSG